VTETSRFRVFQKTYKNGTSEYIVQEYTHTTYSMHSMLLTKSWNYVKMFQTLEEAIKYIKILEGLDLESTKVVWP